MDCDRLFELIGKGPWSGEPHRVEFKWKGLDCMAIRNHRRGHWCGYVGVTKEHPLYKKDAMGIGLEAHGGISYNEACADIVCHMSDNSKDLTWWIGFDCMHGYDTVPMDEYLAKETGWYREFPNGKSYRDIVYVKKVIRKLAKQLIEKSSG